MKTRAFPRLSAGLVLVLTCSILPPAWSQSSGTRRSESAADRAGNFFLRVTRKLERSMESPEQRRTKRTASSQRWESRQAPVQQQIARPQLGSNTPAGSRVWDAASQQWVRAGSAVSPTAATTVYTAPGSLTVPSPQPSLPGVRLQSKPGGTAPVVTDPALYSGFGGGETQYLDPAVPAPGAPADAVSPGTSDPLLTPQPSETVSPVAAKPKKPLPPPTFGTPVPGKPGFVYPPGVEQETKHMLDVRGLASGQRVKDPRSGNIFLVP